MAKNVKSNVTAAQVIESLENFSMEDLVAIQDNVASVIENVREAAKADLQKQIAELAAKQGFEISDVFSAAGRRKIVPKRTFIHPDDASKTWSGLGAKPRWFTELQAAGRQAIVKENKPVGDVQVETEQAA